MIFKKKIIYFSIILLFGLNSMQPIVNVPHFKRQWKNINTDNMTFLSGLFDMTDNVVGLAKVNKEKYYEKINFRIFENKIFRIEISDNVSHGFKDITKNSESNPFNMGHIREGHNNDDETSEYGIGMKKTMIYLSDKVEVYTKCVNEEETVYYRIEMDFKEMASREDPSKSYEFTSFGVITREHFISKKPDDIGSLIILSNVNYSHLGEPCLETKDKQDDFFNNIRVNLGKTFRGHIGKNIDIFVNDIAVEQAVDIAGKKEVEYKTNIDMFVRMNKEHRIESIFINNLKKKTWGEYDNNNYKIITLTKTEIESKMDGHNYLNIKLFSCIDFNHDEEELHAGFTEMIRDGRSFGKIKLTKPQKDGYSNYIYSRVEWKQKVLNEYLSLSSNKTIVKKENILYRAISRTLTLVENEYRRKIREISSNKKTEEEIPILESPEEPHIQTEETEEEIHVKQEPEEVATEEADEVATEEHEEVATEEPDEEIPVKQEVVEQVLDEETEDEEVEKPILKKEIKKKVEIPRMKEEIRRSLLDKIINTDKRTQAKIIYKLLNEIEDDIVLEILNM